MRTSIAAAAAMAVAGAYAQAVSYTTVTYDDCADMPAETMITVTNGITVTYCPECEHEHMTKPHHPHPRPGRPGHVGHTTVYTTTYLSLCETGMVPATYTVTESCTEPTPTWTPGPHHIPQGFTVTEKDCHVCDKTPTRVTITEPCGCDATEGVPATNMNPAPTGNGWSPPGGSYPEGSLAMPSGGASRPPACDGEDCGGSSTHGCDGDDCDECDGEDCGESSSTGSSTPECNGEDCGGSSTHGCDGEDCGGSSTHECDGEDCGQSPAGPPSPDSHPMPGSSPGAPPYPTPTGTEHCPGPQCRAHATGGMPPGVETGTSPPIMPAEGGASTLSSLAWLSSTLIAFVVAALAFAL